MKKWGSVEIMMTMLFVCAFEFAPGPILWLYIGEILNDTGISVAVFLNWFITLIVGLVSPSIINYFGIGPTFLMFGCFNAFSAIFISIFMKETRGISSEKA